MMLILPDNRVGEVDIVWSDGPFRLENWDLVDAAKYPPLLDAVYRLRTAVEQLV